MHETIKHPLVTHLEKLRDREDNAAMAKLKRSLGKEDENGSVDARQYVVGFLPAERWKHRYLFLIAALFATHPDKAADGVSVGTVFRRIKSKTGSDSIERRFEALLKADAEDVCMHLRQTVSLAKSSGVAIDYHRLLSDLYGWKHDRQYVQLSWSQDFWGGASSNENEQSKHS